MEKYLSHFSALNYYPFPLAQQYYAEKFNLHNCQEFSVLSHQDRRFRKNIKFHLCSQQLPNNSLRSVEKGKIVSPYLMYLQLLRGIDIHETILLGNLLCAYQNGPFSDAYITQEKLQNFIKSTTGIHGTKKATRAIDYIQNGACSIMEVFLHMIMRLPMNLGGLNINGGQFNYPIKLDYVCSNILGKKVLFADYCFPKEKIIYEYQGDYHKETIDPDSNRIMILRKIGYEVICVTKTQFYDMNKLSFLLTDIAKRHGIRLRIRTDKFENGLKRIHSLLPKKSNC